MAIEAHGLVHRDFTDGKHWDVLVIKLYDSSGGALVGPRWLDHLLFALRVDPRNGLAGPSTNRSWNEQAVFPSSESILENVASATAEAFRRTGGAMRTLEPLYSLADFCYAVRREVIEAIGLADVSYGVGPCWEMDYNIRAARAGWRGVWASAAYVYLPPARFWLTRTELQARMFIGDVHGGTLVYWKRLISEGLRYPAISLAEDAAFIYAALRARKRLLRLSNDGLFVYVRHGRNAWQFEPGKFLDPAGWDLIPPPAGFTADKISAYRAAVAASAKVMG